MNKSIYIIVLFISNSLFSQIEIDWLLLRNVYYKSEYNKEMSEYFQVAYFGETIESLDNKKVRITGYMLTLAPDDGVFVLSENAYADCFFCGFGGPESAIELRLKEKNSDFMMDELVTVTGILRLKREDVSSGVYIIDNALAVRK
jgi:hypothetical protein